MNKIDNKAQEDLSVSDYIQRKNFEGITSINQLPGMWELDTELMEEFDNQLLKYESIDGKYDLVSLDAAWAAAWKKCGIDDFLDD